MLIQIQSLIFKYTESCSFFKNNQPRVSLIQISIYYMSQCHHSRWSLIPTKNLCNIWNKLTKTLLNCNVLPLFITNDYRTSFNITASNIKHCISEIVQHISWNKVREKNYTKGKTVTLLVKHHHVTALQIQKVQVIFAIMTSEGSKDELQCRLNIPEALGKVKQEV